MDPRRTKLESFSRTLGSCMLLKLLAFSQMDVMSRCEKKWRREPRSCVAVSASQDDNGQGVCCCVVPVAVLYFYRRNGEWGMEPGGMFWRSRTFQEKLRGICLIMLRGSQARRDLAGFHSQSCCSATILHLFRKSSLN